MQWSGSIETRPIFSLTWMTSWSSIISPGMLPQKTRSPRRSGADSGSSSPTCCEQIEIARRGDAAQLQRELDEAAAVDAVAGAAARQPGRAEQPLRDGRGILVMLALGAQIG